MRGPVELIYRGPGSGLTSVLCCANHKERYFLAGNRPALRYFKENSHV
jgi:hypothetical protein